MNADTNRGAQTDQLRVLREMPPDAARLLRRAPAPLLTSVARTWAQVVLRLEAEGVVLDPIVHDAVARATIGAVTDLLSLLAADRRDPQEKIP